LRNQALHYCINIDKIETAQDRASVLSQIPSQAAKPLQKLLTTLSGKPFADFLKELESVAEVCQLQLKPVDKKRERQLLLTHREAFMTQLTSETNPATVLHIIVVLLYMKKYSVVVHAPGRCVSMILSKLKSQIPAEDFEKLSELQVLVVKFLTKEQPDTDKLLAEKLQTAKQIVLGS